MLLEIDLYIDIIFLINFIMDFLIFFLTKKLLRINTTYIRLGISSATAAVTYCIAIVYFEFTIVNKIILSLLIFIVPIIIGFRPKGIVELFKILISVYIMTVIVGGVTFASMYYISTNSYMQNFIFAATSRSTLRLLIFSVLFCYALLKIISVILNQYFIKNKIYPVQISQNKNTAIAKGIIDTGNSLYEPQSFKPVLVSEYEVLKELLPENFETSNEVCKIPYKSVGEANGTLIGVKFDKVVIFDKNIGNLVIENQTIGIYKGKLTNNDEYNILLHPRILG